MHHHHDLDPTTHTVEMVQITELNAALREHRGRPVTAGDIGIDGGTVNADDQLFRICWDGPPDFPYIHAHVGADHGSPGSRTVELHTASLRALSHALGLRHLWGAGSA